MSQDPSTRLRIAEQIRKAADQAAPLKAFVADGFVDEIIHVVDQRSEVDRFNAFRPSKPFRRVSPRPPEEAPIWNW